MKEHVLKTDQIPFKATVAGRKNWEIRKNDRGYQVGDVLILRETIHTGQEMSEGSPLEYTGRVCEVWVTLIIDGYGLGWCVMSTQACKIC